jgi:hypothetical protein
LGQVRARENVMSAIPMLEGAGTTSVTSPSLRIAVVPVDRCESGLRDSITLLDRQSPFAHPFQTEAFCALANTDFSRSPYVIIAEDARGLAAYWWGYFVRYDAGLRHGSTAWARSGPVIRVDLVNNQSSLMREMLAVLKAHVRKQGIGWIIITSEALYGSRMEETCRSAGFSQSDLATFVVDLRPSLEEIWQGLDPRVRGSVRKARKNGVAIEEATSDADIRAYFRMDVEMATVPGEFRPPEEHFVSGCRGLSGKSQGRLLVAKHDEQLVAGSLILHHQGFAAQHAHAIYREGRSVRAGDLLVWQSLSAMKEFGCTRYDFVTVEVAPPPGSREAGVREFKAKWGGTLLKTPAYRYLSPMRRFWHKLRAFAR